MPEAGTDGYQFDPTAAIPKEGFNFWLGDNIVDEVEVACEPVINSTAACDKQVTQSVLLAMENNSNLLSIKDDNCSNASTCGSERSAFHLTSCSSSEARSSTLDINQIMDENDNVENSSSPGEVGHLWGEMARDESTDGNHGSTDRNSQEVDGLESDSLDHAYIRRNFSNDPDLMTWYCLGTCWKWLILQNAGHVSERRLISPL